MDNGNFVFCQNSENPFVFSEWVKLKGFLCLLDWLHYFLINARSALTSRYKRYDFSSTTFMIGSKRSNQSWRIWIMQLRILSFWIYLCGTYFPWTRVRVFLLTLNKDSDLFGASSEQNKDPSFLSYLFVSNKVVARSVSETANKSSIYDSFCLRKYALLRINVTCFQTRVDHTHPSFFWQCE